MCEICGLAQDLINANGGLSLEAAAEFARRIHRAEDLEDYPEMTRIIQEALYGEECCAA